MRESKHSQQEVEYSSLKLLVAKTDKVPAADEEQVNKSKKSTE